VSDPSAIAAAEERGRRRGVIAQWGKIHELLALVDELADDLAPFTSERVGTKWNRLRSGIEDLAPRDSECIALCRTTHVCEHGREHLPAEAPRDSGLGLKLRSDPRFDPDDDIAPRDSGKERE
jgi:hypothetical protein